MKLNEFYQIANGLAPKTLSDEYCKRYGAYDNSGILVATGDELKGVLFSLDLSLNAIEKAKQTGSNLIVTHHPAVYGKIGEINAEKDLLGEKLVECIKNGISVVSMHLNLDCATDGIDDSLAKGICLAAGTSAGFAPTVMHSLSEGGYGKAYEIAPTSVGELASAIAKELSTERVLTYGKEKSVSRVASFCGAGADNEAVAFAVANGANVIVSADFKHHVITDALEAGLAVIALTHYASEYYGFKKYYEKISQAVEIPCTLYTDTQLL